MFSTYMLVNDNIGFIHASYILPGVLQVASEINNDDIMFGVSRLTSL